LQAVDGASRKLAEAQAKLTEAAHQAGREPSPAERASVEASTLAELSAAYRDQVAQIGRAIVAEKAIGDSYDHGARSVTEATNRQKAMEEARKSFTEGTPAYTTAVSRMTAELNKLSAAQADNVTRQQNLQSAQNLEFIQKEIDLVGATVEVRNRELAVLKERQALIARGADLDSEASQKALAYARQLSDAQSELTRQQQIITDFQNIATQAFDQVGNAITQAFVNGGGAAINFGNIAKSILATVLQEALKLAVLNPLLNELFGGNRTTLGSVGGLLGNLFGGSSTTNSLTSIAGGIAANVASGGNTEGGGLGSLLTYGGLAYKGADLLSGGAIGSYLGGQLSGVGEGIGSLLGLGSAGISAGAANAAVNTAATVALGGGAAVNTGVGAGSAVASSAGAIAGYALPVVGAIASSAMAAAQGNYTGAGLIAAGAMIGTAFGPIGTAVGALIGTIASLFTGPHPENPYSNIEIKPTAEGLLGIGDVKYQKEDPTEAVKQAQKDIVALNTYMAQHNIQAQTPVPNAPYFFGIGDNIKGYPQFANLASGFGNLGFTSTDETLNRQIAGKSFASDTELQAIVKIVEQFKNEVVPQLLANADAIGKTGTTFNDQMTSTLAAYDDAIVRAKELQYGEEALTAARAKTAAYLQEQQRLVQAGIDQGLTTRYLQARSATTGDPQYAYQAAQAAYEAQASAEATKIYETLHDTFGDAIWYSQDYVNTMTLLEKTQQEERLVLARQYGQDQVANAKAVADQQAAIWAQATADTSKSITSLADYVLKLQTSAASPLSPQDQLDIAQKQFNAVAGAAQAGDYRSVSQLQGFADTYLSASRNVYGSGAAYVADFGRVLDVLEQISTAPSDALTASVLQLETRTQTATLVDELQRLRAEVTALRQEVAQGSAAPMRLLA
jgi:hypothetical protein